jgi:hypothetical protein
MPNYPKNPVTHLPSGQKIPASWQNRRSPFDDNPVSETGYALQGGVDSSKISAEQDLDHEAVDSSSDEVSESQSMPDAEPLIEIDKGN